MISFENVSHFHINDTKSIYLYNISRIEHGLRNISIESNKCISFLNNRTIDNIVVNKYIHHIAKKHY